MTSLAWPTADTNSFAYTECAGSTCNLGSPLLGKIPVSSGAFGAGVDLSTPPGTVTYFWGDSSGVHRTAFQIIF